METSALIQDLNRLQDWGLAEGLTLEQLEERLAEKLNGLILSDLNALISFLYRVDVSEAKLKQLLKEHPQEDAGRLMARLVMERMWQKIETRRKFSKGAER